MWTKIIQHTIGMMRNIIEITLLSVIITLAVFILLMAASEHQSPKPIDFNYPTTCNVSD